MDGGSRPVDWLARIACQSAIPDLLGNTEQARWLDQRTRILAPNQARARFRRPLCEAHLSGRRLHGLLLFRFGGRVDADTAHVPGWRGHLRHGGSLGRIRAGTEVAAESQPRREVS